MRPVLVTIAPLLAAAVLVMVGGERLARKETETRIPGDRQRLMDLADSFRLELIRLDGLYVAHLEEIAAYAMYGKAGEAETQGRAVVGTRLIRVFKSRGKDAAIPLSQDAGTFPEIELEGRKRPLDEKSAVVLPSSLPDQGVAPAHRWQATATPGLGVYCTRPEPGTLVAILVDLAEVRETTRTHLADNLPWLERHYKGGKYPDGTDFSSYRSTGGPNAVSILETNLNYTWNGVLSLDLFF